MYGFEKFADTWEELFHDEWIARGRQLRRRPVKVVVAPATCLECKLCPQLQENGYSVTAAKNRRQLLDYLGSELIRGNGLSDIDLIVVDADAAGGLDAAQTLRQAGIGVPIILLGDRSDLRHQGIESDLGDVICVRKPIDVDNVLLLVKNAVAKPRTRRPTVEMPSAPDCAWERPEKRSYQPFVAHATTWAAGNSGQGARAQRHASAMGRQLAVHQPRACS
jgi:CheY-like chemotaxis protein